MLIVAVLALLVAAAASGAGAALVRSERRASARDRASLIAVVERQADQLCNLTGRPWTPPPVREAWPKDGEIADRPRDTGDDDVEARVARQW